MTTSTQSHSQQDALIRRCYTLAAGLRTPYGPRVLFSLVALVILIIFYQVVSQGVQASELRLQTAVAYERANQRCKAMGGRSARDDCFEQIKAGAMDSTEPLL